MTDEERLRKLILTMLRDDAQWAGLLRELEEVMSAGYMADQLERMLKEEGGSPIGVPSSLDQNSGTPTSRHSPDA